MIGSFPSLSPIVRISADLVFHSQTLIENNAEIEVTGNSFVHPVHTEVPVQDLNSELQDVPVSDEPIGNQSDRRKYSPQW